ncbi:MAG: CDP-glycerol glycerophosphotransferase family protein [Planctomycetaceae bacterium]|jgi:hypothetical protein|nr:CDP-glycerol glycerophosphotransferase family protein [Planctomycetaceae bacterium]
MPTLKTIIRPIYKPIKPFAQWIMRLIYKPLKLLRERNLIVKLKKKRPIHVVFQVHESAKWSCQSLYDAFDKDPMFTVQIVVILFHGIQEYKNTLRFFQEKGLNVTGLFDEQSGNNTSPADFSPDIVFFQEPMNWWFKRGTALFCYIPYSICQTKNFKWGYNGNFHYLLWRHFVETPYQLDFAKQYGATKGNGVVVSGWPKMDVFLRDDSQTIKCPLWKTNSPDTKRIIYAPHWTVAENGGGLLLGTFLQYYQLLFDYVRQHSEIEMVLKPHPSLKILILQKGLMTEEVLNAFFEQWNTLPNGSVVEGGDYFDLFKTSDAMILDSVSFICEYAYTAKPSLFLCRRRDVLENDFNKFGQETTKNLYQAHSFEDIETFIQDTVIGGNDPLKQSREKFLKNVLKRDTNSAADFIHHYIKEKLS